MADVKVIICEDINRKEETEIKYSEKSEYNAGYVAGYAAGVIKTKKEVE